MSKGNQAPQRAVQGLRWFSDAGQLGWVLPTNAPLRAGRVAKPNQATTVSPLMVEPDSGFVAQGRHSLVSPAWLRFIRFGVLRYRHVQRGKPLKMTGSMMHAFCYKGKQKTLRAGFYTTPSRPPSSTIGRRRGWKRSSHCPAKQSTCRLCFDYRGSPWSLHEVTLVAQMVFRDMIENHQDLTSY